MFGTIGAIGAIFMSSKALESNAYNDFEKQLLRKINGQAQDKLHKRGINFELAPVKKD